MSGPIRLGIIGTGIIVYSTHWPAIHSLGDEYQVAALCNRTPAKAEALAVQIEAATGRRPPVFADYGQMLREVDLDAVSLALPTGLNLEITEAALAAGRHVLLEKPIAANLADAAVMLPWPERYGKVLMISENNRFMPGYVRAAKLVAEGAIGRPLVSEWMVFSYTPPDSRWLTTPWRAEPVHLGGFLSDGGVHFISTLRSLMGEAAGVKASAAAYRPELKPLDTLAAVINWRSGALGTYHNTYAVKGPALPVRVSGTAGHLAATATTVELTGADGQSQRWEDAMPFNGIDGCYAAFAAAVRTGRPPAYGALDGYRDLQLIDAMLRSAASGREEIVADPPA